MQGFATHERRPARRWRSLDRSEEHWNASRRRAWREAVQQLKASRAEMDRADYELIRQMRAAGLSWPAIGREMGERGWMGVYRRHQRLERRFGQAQPDSNQPPTTSSPDG